MLPYPTLIQLDKKSATPVFLQLTNELVKLIQNGQLTAGAKLPSSRKLAELFHLNRNTITKAIEELEALGWVIIRPKKGTFVVDTFPIIKPTNWPNSDQNIGFDKKQTYTFYDFPHLRKPDAYVHTLGFDDGLPDVRLAPIDDLARGYARNLRQLAFEKELSYKDGLGNIFLREQLTQMLNETRGLNITPSQILITKGTVMAIHLAVAATVHQGDKVIVGETNYKTANMIIQHFGGTLIPIPVDDKGLLVSAIPKLCKAQKIRAIYVTSHHHHPTTVTLSPERRMQLLKMANQYNFVILEDDYDYDFHYDNSPVLPLASGDRAGRVLYFGSFSKIIAPAFRVGYLVGPSRLIQALPKLRRILDRQGDYILEKTIADLIADGTIRRHLKKSLRHYKARRNLCCELLTQELGDQISFEKPAGGMAIWANFDSAINVQQLSRKMIQKGVYLSNGFTYNPINKNLNSIRMGFASLNLTEIEHCIEVLKKLSMNHKF